MKSITILILLLLLTSCDIFKPTEWESAPTDYTCTNEQFIEVAKRTKICNSLTNYTLSYCYSTSIMDVCKLRKKENDRR